MRDLSAGLITTISNKKPNNSLWVGPKTDSWLDPKPKPTFKYLKEQFLIAHFLFRLTQNVAQIVEHHKI